MALFVVLGRVAKPAALREVVVDPELGLAVDEHRGDAIEGGQGLIAARVDRRHTAMVPVVLEGDRVAPQPDGAGLGGHDQQRVRTGGEAAARAAADVYLAAAGR